MSDTALKLALQQRYGHAAPSLATAPWPGDDVLQQLLNHRSVRTYTPQPLAEGTLERLVAAAQSAATSSNLHAWSVVAVQNPERKAQLAQWCGQQSHVHNAPLFLVWLADLSRLDRTAARQQRPAAANDYLEQFVIGVVDAALAAQNAVVAAEALGLGTVYIGALRNHADAVAAELQLPAHVFPVFGLCVGHPDPTQPAAVKPRMPQTVVLHHEAYRQPETAPTEAELVAQYDATLQAFQRSQGIPQVAWSEQAAQRVAGPNSLSGRDALQRFVREQGFGLL
ncbi:MAG: NADPH-dependent oxidoreductase [Macromonas sp.]